MVYGIKGLAEVEKRWCKKLLKIYRIVSIINELQDCIRCIPARPEYNLMLSDDVTRFPENIHATVHKCFKNFGLIRKGGYRPIIWDSSVTTAFINWDTISNLQTILENDI